MTTIKVLVRAANTAKLCGESSEDRIWEFAYSTFIADGEDGFSFTVEDLELAFDNIVDHAKIAEEPLPDYILIRRYAVSLTTWKAENFYPCSAHDGDRIAGGRHSAPI